jgi:putative phosphoesterase
MRLAILSDIHGNPWALDAVLDDIQTQGGVDAYWVLGDLAAIGPDPVGVLERLSRLPNLYGVRGNTDRYVTDGERPDPTLAEVEADPRLLPKLVEAAESFAWTRGAVAATGWLDWLRALPLERRLTLPDGTRLLAVHAAPGTDDGTGLNPGLSEAERQAMLAGCDADLVCVGHFHWPVDERVGEVWLVNPGSVSNPFPPDLRASYALLESDATGTRLEHRRVDYDHQAVIDAARKVQHPAAEYIVEYMLGRHEVPWGRSLT